MNLKSIGGWLGKIFKKEEKALRERRKVDDLMHLSIGSQTFVSIRKWGQIYVDKTELINELAKDPGMYLLIRPRRFGKSILLTTLKALFKDGLAYFKGLSIEKLWKDTGKYSVVHLDFSIITYAESLDSLLERLKLEIANNFREFGFNFDENSKRSIAAQLSDWLSTQPAKSVVVLIDEYDSPLTHTVQDEDVFNEICNKMADFYSALIDNEKVLRFLWVTGITKFYHPKLTQTLNKIKDISLEPKYSTLLGFTRGEVKRFYGDYVEKAAIALKLSQEQVMEGLCDAYEGYCFDLVDMHLVMEPWSVLNYLEYPEGKYKPYWAESGQVPQVLMNPKTASSYWNLNAYGKEKKISLNLLKGITDGKPFNSKALLAQAGYLTIKSYDEKSNTVGLKYPNKEVSYWMGGIYINLMTHAPDLSKGQGKKLLKILNDGDADGLVEMIKDAFQTYTFLNQFVQSDWDCVNMVQKVLDSWRVEDSFGKYTSGENDIEFTVGNIRWNLYFKYAHPKDSLDQLVKKKLKKMDTEEEKLKKFALEFRGVLFIYSEKDRKFVRTAISK
ncbi:MAG: AAA family ATPase [Burkholderiales bacterium]|nr:AAA family ATPase [Burkholderiales bacterium]